MSFISKILKAGVAKKALDQAKKPENQAKAKQALAQLRSKAEQRKRSK